MRGTSSGKGDQLSDVACGCLLTTSASPPDCTRLSQIAPDSVWLILGSPTPPFFAAFQPLPTPLFDCGQRYEDARYVSSSLAGEIIIANLLMDWFQCIHWLAIDVVNDCNSSCNSVTVLAVQTQKKLRKGMECTPS